MSPRLVLQFLGLPQIYLDDKPIATDRRKAIALLVYLAMNDIGHPSQKYSRESLIGLFWPDYEQAKAFSNLRRTIWEVHQAIGEDWLIADRESVHLNQNAKIDLDVVQFRDLLATTRQQDDPTLRIPLLIDTVKLYRNHFLTGFSLKDALNFNEWVFSESEELRRNLADALDTLSEDYTTLGEAEKAIPYARRLITLDPLNEESHRTLMEVYIQAGQHSAALKQYQACEQILRKELNLDPQPETRALYKKIRKGEMKSVLVEKRIESITPKDNLPLQLSTFIGREKEQDEIISLILKNRLVTLAGVGGIGKTRLSLQVGQRLLNDYPNGVWFIPLDSLADSTLIPQTVASVFDIREKSDRPIIEILINVLHEKTTLLIFDNCEHLLDACAQLIKTLLTNCPNLKILVTSREILNMQSEATYYLPPLSIPNDDDLLTEKLTQYESVQLFTERAALALSSFKLTKENAQTVVDICRKVDGIPLAIELAAARVNILKVKEILKQLHNSFALLASDSRTTTVRHQTLQASMNWSWGLLTESEQTVMPQLSVFAGGWTLESAQEVCEGNALNLISALVKKSLIMVDQKSGHKTRYRFHAIVRQYAHQRLIETGEEENIRTRHLKYFVKLSEQAEPALRGPTQVEWFARLNDELDNIRTALEWATQTDVEAGLYLLGSLHRFWESLDYREGARWITEFLQKPESNNYPKARAKALLMQGIFLPAFHQFVAARSALQECLDLYRSCNDKPGEIDGLVLMASLTSVKQESMELLTSARALAQSIGDTWRQAHVLTIMGQVNHPRRLSYLNEADALLREAGDMRLLAENAAAIGDLEIMNGDFETAQKWLDEAVMLNQNFSNKNLMGNILYTYGKMALVQGDYEQARTSLHESMVILDKSGIWIGQLWSQVLLGYVALREGNITEAHHIFARSIQEFQKDKNTIIGVVFAIEGMASLFVAVDKLEHAARLIGWTDMTREKIGDTRQPLEQADMDRDIAAILMKIGSDAFEEVYDHGRTMTLDEAVA